MRSPLLVFALASFLTQAALTQGAIAAEAKPPAPLPAAAAPCANCHGTDGRQQGAIPAIAGRPAVALAEKLRQFRADAVADATVMPRLIKGLTEGELDAIAGYFAAIR